MRFVRLALLTSVLTAGQAVAQTTTGGNLGAASAATGTTSTSTSTGGGGTTTSSTSTSTAAPVISGGTITGTTSTATAAGGADKSNFLGGTYSNPYYQGLFSNATGAPGQFGQALYGTTTGTAATATRTGSAAAGRTTTGGANPAGTSGSPTGGRQAGGQFGGGGQAGGAAAQFGGQIVPLPRNIAYSAVLRFPAPAVAPAQRLADVQAVLARSSMMSNPAGVTVVQDGTAFVLRGAVASGDEARLAEGMVRLTPGVRDVRNELTFPKE